MVEPTSENQIEGKGVEWPPLLFTLIFFSCVFFFLPVIALVAIITYGVLLKKLSIPLLTVFVLMISVYLALINITKVPESDLAVYLDWLDLAREQSLGQFMKAISKDPGFSLFLYLLANVPRSSDAFFIFTSTFITYGIFLAALARLGYAQRQPIYVVLGVIIFFALLPPLFNNSAHLMRQFMAGAVIAWFYSDCVSSAKCRWWILLLAFSMHTSAIIFLPFVILGYLRRFSPGRLIMVVGLILCTISLLLKFASPYLVQIPYLGDIIQRAISWSFIDHATLGIAPILLVSLVLTFSIYKLYMGLDSQQLISSNASYILYITTCLLSIFVLWFHFVGETMLATRFLLYEYFLAGPVLLLALVESRQKEIFAGIALTVMPAYFAYKITNGVWTYEGYNIWTSIFSLMPQINS